MVLKQLDKILRRSVIVCFLSLSAKAGLNLPQLFMTTVSEITYFWIWLCNTVHRLQLLQHGRGTLTAVRVVPLGGPCISSLRIVRIHSVSLSTSSWALKSATCSWAIHTLYVYTVYLGERGRDETKEKVREATVHKLGRIYQHDWLYIRCSLSCPA
jgi:hypothetical protein